MEVTVTATQAISDPSITDQSITEESDEYAIPIVGPSLHKQPTLIWFTILYLVVFVIGILGNSLTIAVVGRTRDLQSNTNFFLCNLAVSDLLLLISGIPFDLIYTWRTYPAIAGSWHCILKAQLSETASNVSILTVLILTIERWVAICRPLHLYVYFNKDRIFKYIFCIWLIGASSALLLSVQFAVIPYEVQFSNYSITYDFITKCDIEPSRRIPYIFEMTSVVFFIIPMVMIVGAYGSIIRELNHCQKSNMRKTSMPLENGPQLKARFLIVIMLITVASVFFICFLPLHIQRLMTTYDKKNIGASHDNAAFIQIWFSVAGLLHFISSAINPIIYNLMSRRFRIACKTMILAGARCLRKSFGCSHVEQDHAEIQIELAPMGGHKSTDTTSFKERFAMWLLGGRQRGWNSCYVECQSMDCGAAPLTDQKVDQEWL